MVMNIIYAIRISSDIDNNMTDQKSPQNIVEAQKQAEAKRQEQLKKEAEAKKKAEEAKRKLLEPKPKYYYDVKVECLLPATLTYRVLAEDPQQAAEMIKTLQPNSVRHRLIGRKDLKLMVYDAGSTMIKWMRNLVG